MIEDIGNTQHAALLAALHGCTDLSSYNLTLCYESGDREQDAFRAWCAIVRDPLSHEICHHVVQKNLSYNICRQVLKKNLDRSLEPKTPSVLRYDGGQLCFVVPFTRNRISYFLIGEGTTETGNDVRHSSPLLREGGVEVFPLLADAGTLPTSSMQEVARAARQVMSLLPSLPGQRGAMTAPADVVPRLARTVASLSLIDEVKTIPETIEIAGDLLGFLFEFPSLAIAWRSEEGQEFAVAGRFGFPEHPGALSEEAISELIRPKRMKKSTRIDDRMQGVLGGVLAETVTSFPVTSGRALLGFIYLFDCDLQDGDLLLVELITTRVAAKLTLMKKEQERAKLSELSNRLMSLASTLLLSESKEDLYRTILEIAADLLSASQGSLMLVDHNGAHMHVVHAKGMSSEIAGYLRVQVGTGIAGRVAKTGIPLLVKDVEKDLRIAMRNRPRFKSKSLICIPLKLEDKVLGVLNLSDKANLTCFSERDLNLLTSFATLASLMIERTRVIEEAGRFEQLSLTDHLTGIYNRRFLNNRLEEEMHRSLRQGLELTVLFIDLDNFKEYNDRFGHLAGDEALRKIAGIIKATLRDMDTVARYGGDEFCVLLPGTSKHSARLVAERIRDGIERERFTAGEGGTAARLTASLGAASFPGDGGTVTSLMHASDMALYQAKTNGRNRLFVGGDEASCDQASAPAVPERGSHPAQPFQLARESADLCALLETAGARELEN